MELRVMNTGSEGNGYVLIPSQGRESIILEAGVRAKQVFERIGSKTPAVALVCSHEHNDHAAYLEEYAKRGLQIVASAGTLSQTGAKLGAWWATPIKDGQLIRLGREWQVLGIQVKHDAVEPLGFMLHHPEVGKVLFLTDCGEANIMTNGVAVMMVECNWDTDSMIRSEDLEPLKRRIAANHMGLPTLLAFLKNQNLSTTKCIILIHASRRNCNLALAIEEVQKQTGIPTYAAEKDLIINI